MNKYLFFILAVFIFCSCTNINGSGHIQTETKSVAGFEGVQASGSMDIEVTDGTNQSVKIEADDNILPDIITEVNDGLLDVHFKNNMSFSNVHAKVYVTAPGLKKLYIKGSGSITSTNTIKSETISAKISGSGDIEANVDAPDVKADISGSGSLTLKGHCKNFEGTISGSGDLRCKSLLSENAMVNIYGSGTAHVYSSVKLKALTAGSGDIYYSGSPSSPEITKSGSGSVEAE